MKDFLISMIVALICFVVTIGILVWGGAELVFRMNERQERVSCPQKLASRSCPGTGCAVGVIPQADPNGLFSPASADGTWVLCRDPDPDKSRNRGTLPIYVEPHVVVSPFPLPQAVRP